MVYICHNSIVYLRSVHLLYLIFTSMGGKVGMCRSVPPFFRHTSGKTGLLQSQSAARHRVTLRFTDASLGSLGSCTVTVRLTMILICFCFSLGFWHPVLVFIQENMQVKGGELDEKWNFLSWNVLARDRFLVLCVRDKHTIHFWELNQLPLGKQL